MKQVVSIVLVLAILALGFQGRQQPEQKEKEYNFKFTESQVHRLHYALGKSTAEYPIVAEGLELITKQYNAQRDTTKAKK